tara:strand:- start:17 stop:496 length:480 start_codon:yes stop_codon:yes gene_type:complete
MAINLDTLKNVKNKDSYRSFTYADLSLDIELNSFLPNKPVGVSKNRQDLKLDYDTKAIHNSIKNIFNTKKGQKILNPDFGLDLEQYLFDNISKENADIIGTTIHEELALYEPRITVNNVEIVAIPDQNQYNITINIAIPSLNNETSKFSGVLTSKGVEY